MVSFILQEAEEKAREIKFKAEDAATIEKQTLVRKARLRIQEDYEKKEADLDATKRILMSSAVAKARSRKMKERDVLFQSLQEEEETRGRTRPLCSTFSSRDSSPSTRRW